MAAMRKLELRLKDSPCLVTEDITLADIIIGTCLRPLFMQVFGEVERKNNQNMCVWIDKLYNSVRKEGDCDRVACVLGDVWTYDSLGQCEEGKEEINVFVDKQMKIICFEFASLPRPLGAMLLFQHRHMPIVSHRVQSLRLPIS